MNSDQSNARVWRLPRVRTAAIIGIGVGLMAGTGCRSTGTAAARPAEPPVEAPPVGVRPLPPPDTTPSPESAAAQAMVAQARKLIRAGRFDAALRRLERAVSVHPRDGAGHYWLAQVWLRKGDRGQAREHHRLARRYLASDDTWVDRLAEQRAAVGE